MVGNKKVGNKKTEPVESKKVDITFDIIANQLASADADTRSKAADATAARAARSTVAVDAIRAAVAEGYSAEFVRVALLDRGVLKGTVSKITTIIKAIYDGVIVLSELTSLNGTYTNIMNLRAVAVAGPAPVAQPVMTEAEIEAKIALGVAEGVETRMRQFNPDDAFKVILDHIASLPNSTEKFKVGGEWMTKITTGISDLLKDDEEEED